MDATGKAVVVWDSYLQDGDGWGVYGQRFGADGSPLGGEFQANLASMVGDQRDAAVAARPDGSFVVVWRGLDSSGQGIRARWFDATGSPTGSETVVNGTTSGDQSEPAVAVDGAGTTMIVWQTNHTGNLEVRGRLFNASGSPLGAEFALNTTTANDQQLPAVAGSAGGGFVAAWQSYGQDGPAQGIIARRFSGTGAPLTAEIIANEWTSGDQTRPAVAQVADGAFFVVWQDANHRDGSGWSIQGRWFAGAGTPATGDLQINTLWLYDQTLPRVSARDDGDAMVAWQSMSHDGSDLGIFAQTVDRTGNKLGGEVQANVFTSGPQSLPSTACSDHGTFWVTWSSSGQDGSGEGVYGLFGTMPVDPVVFVDDFESGNTSGWSAAVP
jgi:hypothetical protein